MQKGFVSGLFCITIDAKASIDFCLLVVNCYVQLSLLVNNISTRVPTAD